MLRIIVTGALALTLAVSSYAQETRTVVDALDRTVEVPVQAERITILDPLAALEAALSLGIKPTQIGQRSFVAEYLGDPLLQWPWLEAALAELGADPLRMNADETDLEMVAIGEPDLILGGDSWVERAEEQLSMLAPTVAVPIVDVRSTIKLYGDIFGIADKANQVLADWDARIEAELRTLTPAGATLALVRTDEAGTITIFNAPGHGAYDYFQQAGYTTPPEILALPVNQGGYASSVSLERVDLLESADVIVVLGFSVEATALMLADPIFTSLPAVADGRVVTIAQGPIAQATAVQSPLNFDALLGMAKDVAAAAAKAP